MSLAEVEEYKTFVAMSYDCHEDEIEWEFRRIHPDDKDPDQDDHIWLKYKMRAYENDVPYMRYVHNLKLPIPADVRNRASESKRRQASGVATHHRPIRALPAPSAATITSVEPLAPEDGAPKPRLRTRVAAKK